MSYHQTGPDGAADAACQYGASGLWFRGPARSTDKPFIACVGADETFGRFVPDPYASLLERRLGRRCINLGSLFTGAEALSQDESLREIVNKAELCVLQPPCVLGQSNRYYRVHPRRNDRFLGPTPNLVALYPEVDFTEVHFVRHLVTLLQSYSDARFELVAQELREAWLEAMKGFATGVDAPVILLLLQTSDPAADHSGTDIARDPVPVTEAMFKRLGQVCAGSLSLTVRPSADSDHLEDVLFGTLQQPIAEHVLGPATHRQVADALYGAVLGLS